MLPFYHLLCMTELIGLVPFVVPESHIFVSVSVKKNADDIQDTSAL